MENLNRSWTEIDLDVFKDNLQNLKRFLPNNKFIMQIVKADAYGHGAYQIARKSQEIGAKFLGVANADEGMLLRTQDIKIPILILSPSLVSELNTIIEYDLTPSISDIFMAEKLDLLAEEHSIIKKIHVNRF